MYSKRYNYAMSFELRSTKQFDKWLNKLKDISVKTRVLARLSRVESGNFGDHKKIQTNLFELRFFFGSGLRIYYTIQGRQIIILLVGGNKSTQAKDIEKANDLLAELQE